ncbi:LEAF RUST 10 DISEASE-RESISTANCE LOCUS RECEPTOR-LIKE PROTEIN KINASE-like 2.5 isoform X2 [Tasmannia lanceolata]|uniref:LEAF RUST 10 DISEASE-RESISTANCE LOCUS RECEPTOR-LIKE PROTEIN KINASE-like 2.5 isoform X2 n=1 Tax=Tasmannia lanceolata TaxID=3420 RepID=UPI004063FEC0
MSPPHLLLLLLPLLLFTSARCNPIEYHNCTSSFTCGNNINISYPFWYNNGGDQYCGYPNFGLSCYNQRTVLSLAYAEYYVEDINYNEQTITLVDIDLRQSTCPRARNNVTLENTPLSLYSRVDLNFTLFFNCSSLPFSSAYSLSCLRSGTRQSYIALITGGLNWSGFCEESVVVPVIYTAWNDSVGFGNYSNLLEQGFQLKWSSFTDCGACEASHGYCGYNTTLDFFCICEDGTYPRTCPPGYRNSTMKKKAILGVTIGVGSFLLVCLLFCLSSRWKFSLYKLFFSKMRTKTTCNVEAFIQEYGSLVPQRFSYSDIRKMTSSFKDTLGQGGYGSVFKGKLKDGRLVAVKVLRGSRGNGEEFMNEVASIGRTYHVNIVSLLGFCAEGSKRALIYEFMLNGSLEKFIYTEKPRKTDPLRWETLYQIAVGIARGLEYLHRGCITRILHFDIKPHNILLDQDFCPKISDFGLAKLCPTKDSIISMQDQRGTAGYTAPELFCRNIGGVSHKSDVYSYGMMVLEMVGGRKNIDVSVENISEIYFPHWIYKRLDLNGDLQLHGVTTDEEEKTARKMILVGLWCIQTVPSNRPSMNRVVEMLEGTLEGLQMPPKPYLSSPTRSSHDTSTLSTIIREGSL